MSDIKILHISDTHFGAHDDSKCTALVHFARSWQPDIIALTGDVLDSPLWSAYFDKANTFLATLRQNCHGVYIYCIPGNHDALLGRLCLGRFWRRLQLNTSYVDPRMVRGQGICVICVDSTHFSLRHLNNSGRFDKKRESQLEGKLKILRNDPGFDLDRAIKVVLVHHHPIPTPTAAAEKILYFKNAGLFLNFAVRHSVQLILHGHQHDPHFTRISFGSDRDDDVIGVLSAGSCVKADNSKAETSCCGHFYTVSINTERAFVTAYYYHSSVNRFVPLDEFLVSRAITSDPRMVSLHQLFSVAENGHMEAFETRMYERTLDGPCFVAVNIGVDDESDDCAAIELLELKVKVGDNEAAVSWLEDKPRSKKCKVAVGAGRLGARFRVTIEYTWPGGFRGFLARGTDSGEFSIRSKGVEWCTVELALQDDGRQLEPLNVYYAFRDRIKQSAGCGARQYFTIDSPHANGRISWTARIRTAPPVVTQD